MKHGFVSELVTACKQLAPNLLNAKVDVSYIYIYYIIITRFSATPGGGGYPRQVDT